MKTLADKKLMGIWIALLLLFPGESTFATSLERISFSGIIDRSDVDFGIDAGDLFSGYVSLLYDSSSSPVGPNRYYMQYSYGISFENSLSIIEDSITFSQYIENTDERDILSFWSMSASCSNGMYLDDLSILFGASDGDAFMGTGLPASMDSTLFDYGRVNLLFGMDSVTGVFNTITASSEPVPVPEPGAGCLFVVGIFGICAYKQKRKVFLSAGAFCD